MFGKSPNLAYRAVLLAVIAIVAVLAIAGTRAWQSYHSTLDAAVRAHQHTVQLFQVNAEATLQSVEMLLDRVLADMVDLPPSSRDRAALAERFARMGTPWDFVHGVGFVDADGSLCCLALRKGEKSIPIINDLSKTPRFTDHRDGLVPDGTVRISPPFHNPAADGWMMSVSKTARRPDGSFAGVALVTLSVNGFTKMFGEVGPERSALLGLFKTDGTALLTIPATDYIGRNYGQLAPFRQIRAGSMSAAERVHLRPESELRGGISRPDRNVVYSVSQKYPIITSYSVDDDVVLEPWRRATLAFGGPAVIAIAIIIAMTWWLLRQIAAERAVQLTLRESEHRLREAQRIADVGHFEFDVAADRIRWAENMYRLHGVTAEAYPDGKEALRAVVHPEDRGVFEVGQSRRMKGGTTEHRILRPDGAVRIIRYEWRLVEGFPVGQERVFGVAQDLTDIRKAEAALRQNEQRLRDLLESTSDIIWETNASLVLTLFTGKGAERYRLTRYAGIQVTDDDLPDAADGLAVRDAMRRRESFRNLVMRARDDTGEIRWIRGNGKPLFDANGTFLGYRGTCTDVTESRRQEQLDEDKRKAEALGRLASGIAHEINNLLQPIIIYSAFGGSDQETGPAQQRYFRRIGRAAEAASKIVRNVLSFARERPPHRQNVVVADAVREVLDLLGDTLPLGIARVVESIDAACVVAVDRSGFDQALTNLITNAAEAMPTGGTITVSAHVSYIAPGSAQKAGLEPESYCILSVADTGTGIPLDQIDKVFDPFFTTKPQGKGTGLGLSVVAGHAKSWGGTATVSSVYGEGTMFSLYLPLAQPQMMAAQ